MKITETIKNFKKYAKGVKRKIALLAGLSVSLTACGTNTNSNTQQYAEGKLGAKEFGASIVQEIDENEVKVESVEETTNDKGETVKVSEGTTENGEKVKITETTNESGETVKVIETTNDKGETVKVTEKTNDKGETVKVTEKKDSNGNVTEKIEEVTEPKTEIKTEPKTEQVTTTKVNNNNIKTTTTQVTTKPVNTTKAVQTTAKPVVTTVQTTAKPIVTTQATQPPTKPIKTSYNKYDLLDQDPEVAAAAFERLSNEMWKELYKDTAINMSGRFTNGYPECQAVLAVLNYGEGINPEAIADISNLGNYSWEELVDNSRIINFAQIEEATGGKVDFNKYMLNEEFASFINRTNNAWLNYKNGNTSEFDSISDDFFENLNLGSNESYIKLNYMIQAENTLRGAASEDDLIEAQRLYEENIINPLYDSYSQYIGRSYKR